MRNQVRNKHWQAITPLAAELASEHRMDLNELQKLIFYVQSRTPAADTLLAWLDAQIEAAQFFPRSNQTVRYALVNRELIEYLWEYDSGLAQQPQRLAQVLGWIVRLMYYYRQNPSAAKDDQSRQQRLHIPAPRPPQMVTRPARRSQPQAETPDIPAIDEVSDFAKEFFKRLQQKKDE